MSFSRDKNATDGNETGRPGQISRLICFSALPLKLTHYLLVQYIGDTLPFPGARETLDDLEGSPVVQRLMGTNGIVHFLPG